MLSIARPPLATLGESIHVSQTARTVPRSPARKKRIDKAADLPRFSYKLDGRIEDMVRDDAKFKSFATEVRRDLESVLAQYEIEDKATLRQILGELAQLDMLDGSYEAALARVAQIKALEDKPADKLLSGITSRAIAAGVHAAPDRSSAAYRGA